MMQDDATFLQSVKNEMTINLSMFYPLVKDKAHRDVKSYLIVTI